MPKQCSMAMFALILTVLIALFLLIKKPGIVAPAVVSEGLEKFAAGSELESVFAFDRTSGILVYAYDSGSGGIFTVDTRSAGSPVRVPVAGDWPKDPIISKGGRYIAYADVRAHILGNERTLYVFDRETSTSRALRSHSKTDHLGRAIFTPDGTSLIYEYFHVTRQIGVDEFRIVDLATFEDRSLHLDQGMGAHSPSVSVNGSQLYFFSGKCLTRLALSAEKAVKGEMQTIACLPAGVELYPPISPDPPVVLDDQSQALFTVHERGCPRIAIVTLATGAVRLLDQNECGLRPQFSGANQESVVYIALPLNGNRLVKVRQRGGEQPRVLGPSPAMTYRVFADGNLIYALLATPDTTRRIWQFDLNSDSRREIAVGDHLEAERSLVRDMEQVTVPSFDGLEIPVRIFRPACRSAGIGPALIYIHGSSGGREDVSPRLTREIGYLLGRGVTVIAPNYRGSTGYGDRLGADMTRESQVKDLVAVTNAVRSRADIDKEQLYVMGICYSAEYLLNDLVDGQKGSYRGIVAWSGGLSVAHSLDSDRPNALWIITSRDTTLQQLEVLPDSDRRLLLDGIKVHIIDDTHLVVDGKSRKSALNAVADFIEARSEVSCR